MKILFCLIPFSLYSFDYPQYSKGCLRGVALGQEFLQAKELKKDKKELESRCPIKKDFQEKLKMLSKKDSKIYGCGAGINLTLYFYKQQSLLPSPRVRKLMEQCETF